MAKRDLGKELLQSVKDIKAGKGKRRKVSVASNIIKIRENLGFTQYEFAEVLCVALRTVKDWELGRRKPTGSAFALIRLAETNPKAFQS